MKLKKGRPKLYTEVVLALPDHQCFTPASIAYFGLRHKLLKKESAYIRDKMMITRVRSTLARFAVKYMPAYGDGLVHISGQGVGPGWFGWRWKQAYVEEIWPQNSPVLAPGEVPHTGIDKNRYWPPAEVPIVFEFEFDSPGEVKKEPESG